MKLTVERLPESQVRLDIAADEAEFAEAVEKAARKVSRISRARLPRGRVRHMIERMYGREIFLEEAGRLIMDDLYRKALEQEELTPVGSPDVQVTQMDPVAFTVEVPVYPTVTPAITPLSGLSRRTPRSPRAMSMRCSSGCARPPARGSTRLRSARRRRATRSPSTSR